jgi:hypothetical protein
VINNKDKKTIRWIVIIIVAVVLWFMYNWGGNLLRPVAIRQIREMTGARVDIGKISFRLSGKIRLENVRIGPLIKTEPDNAILTAKDLDVSFSLLSFLKFSPQIKQIRLVDFVLNAQFNNDTKQWNILALKLPAGRKGFKMPGFRFKRGEMKFAQISDGKEIKTIACRVRSGSAKTEQRQDLSILTIAEDDATETSGDRIFVRWTKGQNPQIEVEGYLPQLDLELFGSRCNLNSFYSKVVSDNNSIAFEKTTIAIGPATVIDVNGTIADLKTDPSFVFGVRMKDLTVRYEPADNCFAHGSRIFDKFIPLLQVFFDNFNPQGLLDLDVVLTGKVKEIAKTQCKGYLGCKDISIKYFEFPYLVEHLAGNIDVTETSMTMKDIKAAHGKVDIIMNGYCDGFGKTMDSRVVLSSNNMILDEDLYVALLEHHKKLWSIFSPAGIVSGDFIYTAKPPDTRRMELYADLLDVSIMCQYFPYQVAGITGKLSVDGDLIELKDVVSKQNGGTIKMQGVITQADTVNPVYDFKIQAQNVAIDKTLISAFPAEQKKFFSDFEIQAKGDADIYIHSVNDVQIPVDYLAKLNMRGEAIKHPLLPDVLKDVTLDANLTPLTFEIKKFNATFRENPIDAAGTIWMATEKEPVGYCMWLKAMNFNPDSNTVASVLGQGSVKMMEDFQFTGRVNLEAAISKNARIKCPEFEVAVDCLSNTAVISKLNMPLKDITGRIIIEPENIEFASLAATPAGSAPAETIPRIILDGKMKTDPQGIDTAELKLSAKDMPLDDSLVPVLGKLGDYYSQSYPAGKFDVNLDKIKLLKNDSNERTLLVNGTMAFKDCSIGQDKGISNIFALCDVDAAYKVGGGLERCRLFLDFQNIAIEQRPFNNLKLPIVVDVNNNKIIIDNFVGDCLGGKISGNAVVETDKESKFSKYQIDMALANVNTEGFVSPQTVSAEKTPGQTNAELHVQGDFQNPDVTMGRFIAEAKGIKPKKTGIVTQIRTKIYETVKKDMALDNVSIQSVIKGREVQISRFDIYGPTASLRGTGTYQLGTNSINVNFTAYSAAGKEEPGFIESLTAGFGPAFLKVDMTGKLENPDIKVYPLPILNKSIEMIGTR